MKKIFLMLLVAALLTICFVSCGKQDASSASQSGGKDTATASEEKKEDGTESTLEKATTGKSDIFIDENDNGDKDMNVPFDELMKS